MITSMKWRRVWSLVRLTLLLVVTVAIITPEWPAFGDAKFKFQAIVGRENRFDFLTWTAEALGNKAEAVLAGTQRYLPEETKKNLVLSHLEQLATAQRLEAEIERVYADPAVTDSEATTAELRAERDAVRAQLARRQSLVEAIV